MAAADRILQLKLVTDVSSIDKSLHGVQGKLAGISATFVSFAKGAALGLVLEGFDKLATAVSGGIDDFLESERVANNLAVTWSGLGLNLSTLAGVMDAVSGTALDLGFDDAEALTAFDAFLKRTGDATVANALLAASMDLARSKNVSLGDAAAEVGRIYQGSAKTLAAYGVAGVTGMAAVDAAMVTTAGNAAVFAATTQGKWAVLQGKTSEVFETIGGLIVGAFDPVVLFITDTLLPKLDGVMAKWDELAPSLQMVIDLIKPILEIAMTAFNSLFVEPMTAAMDIVADLFRLDLTGAVRRAVKMVENMVKPLVGVVEGVADGISDAFDGALGHIQNAIGIVRDLINNLIDGFNLVLAATGQAQIGHIGTGGHNGQRSTGHFGQNAGGTSNWRGGLTWVGEQGKELVNLPRGSQVFPHAQSMAMAGGVTIVYSPQYSTASPIEAQRFVQSILPDLKRAMGRTG